MKISIMDRAKKKKFVAGLANLGMKKIPQMLVKSGKERVRAFSGSMNKDELYDFWRLMPIEGVGLYVGKDMVNRNGVREIRLSLDGMHVWKDQLTEKNLVLTEEQEEEWFKGNNIELNDEQKKEFGGVMAARGILSKEGTKVPSSSGRFVCVKSADGKDFVGNGKLGAGAETLFGFLPKERRRKSQTI